MHIIFVWCSTVVIEEVFEKHFFSSNLQRIFMHVLGLLFD